MHLDPSPRRAAPFGVLWQLRHRHVLRSFGRRLAIVGTWAQRARQRRSLACLNDRLLRDIGISREQAEAEIIRPFWRR